MRVTSSPLIRFLGTVTNPAAETKSIGLSADTLLSWFLQRHLDNYSMTRQILPVYQDYAIWTVPSGRENPRPSTGTFAKTLPAPTQTATPHTTGPLAIIRSKSDHSAARTASNFIHLDKTFFHRLSICTTMLNWSFPYFVTGDKSVYLDNFRRSAS